MDTLIVSDRLKDKTLISKDSNIVDIIPWGDYPELTLTDYHLLIFDISDANAYEYLRRVFITDISTALRYGIKIIFLIRPIKANFNLSTANVWISFEFSKGRNRDILNTTPQIIKNYLNKISGYEYIIGNASFLEDKSELKIPFGGGYRILDILGFSKTEITNKIISCGIPIDAGLLLILPTKDVLTEEDAELIYNIGRFFTGEREEKIISCPPWIKELNILNEKDLRERRQEAENEIKLIDSKLIEYFDYKSILYLKHDLLTERIMNIFNRLGMFTERDEKYEEDFWILDNNKRREFICEVKGTKHNIIRQDVNDLDNHREIHKLPVAFKGILIANNFNEALSYNEKDKEINADICKLASAHNVIILRALDLLNVLNNSNLVEFIKEFHKKLKDENGWFEIARDGEFKIHK